MTISVSDAYAAIRGRMCLSSAFLLGCIDDVEAQLTLLPVSAERESLSRRLAECAEEFARWANRPASDAGRRAFVSELVALARRVSDLLELEEVETAVTERQIQVAHAV
jgi:hypothetical protein